jgi:hypothetical protein
VPKPARSNPMSSPPAPAKRLTTVKALVGTQASYPRHAIVAKFLDVVDAPGAAARPAGAAPDVNLPGLPVPPRQA